MFEHFTEGARAVLAEAQDVAVELGATYLIARTTDPHHPAHHGPPLCRGDTWTVTDQTLAQAAS